MPFLSVPLYVCWWGWGVGGGCVVLCGGGGGGGGGANKIPSGKRAPQFETGTVR